MSENFKAVFTNRIFRIPDYQRGYAWGDRQLDDLWEDIEEIQYNCSENCFEKHYTGTIFIEKKPSNLIPNDEMWLKGVNHYHVVDGQQRLTSIVILVFCLIKSGETEFCGETIERIKETFILQKNSTGNSKVYKFAYEGYLSNFLFNEIFEDHEEVQTEEGFSLYASNLKRAKNYFDEKLRNKSKQEKDDLYQKIISSLIFDVKELSSEFDVQTVFETMNNRGKSLTILEKLKNRLFYLCDRVTKEEDRSTLRRIINNSWSRIFKVLAKNYNNVLDEDEFVSAHLTLYRTPVADYTVYTFSTEAAETKLFQMFCNHPERFKKGLDSEGLEPEISFGKISDYVLSLSDFVEYWYTVNNSDESIIRKILLLNNSKEIKVFLCMVLKYYGEKTGSRVLQVVEKLLFRKRSFVWDNFDERYFSNMARELFNGKKSIEEIDEELNSVISEEVNIDQICNQFSQLFEYVRGNKGFHRWQALKYLLFEYEEMLWKKEVGDSMKVGITDYASTTIEHVIPQHYEKWWENEVEDFIKNFSDEQKEQAKKVLINSLGNLTILKNGKNASVQDNPWKTNGKVGGKQDRYRTGSFNEIEISRVENWNKNSVLERGMKILDLIIDKLGCQSISDDIKHRMLFYNDEFYSKGFSDWQ